MSCPCGFGNLNERETTSGHEILLCGEHDHIYLASSQVGTIAPRGFEHKFQEIAHGLHLEWPPVPDQRTVGFRIWLPSGVPLEADRASIVEILDPESLVSRDPSLHPAMYPSPEEIVATSLSWPTRYGTEAAQVRFDFGRQPGVESRSTKPTCLNALSPSWIDTKASMPSSPPTLPSNTESDRCSPPATNELSYPHRSGSPPTGYPGLDGEQSSAPLRSAQLVSTTSTNSTNGPHPETTCGSSTVPTNSPIPRLLNAPTSKI